MRHLKYTLVIANLLSATSCLCTNVASSACHRQQLKMLLNIHVLVFTARIPREITSAAKYSYISLYDKVSSYFRHKLDEGLDSMVRFLNALY